MPKFLTKEEYMENVRVNARKYYPLMKKISENIVSNAEANVTSQLEEFKYSQTISLNKQVNESDLDNIQKGHMGYRLCSQLKDDVENLLKDKYVGVNNSYTRADSRCQITIYGRSFFYNDFEKDLVFEKSELKQSELKQSELKQSELKQSELKQSELKQSELKQSELKQNNFPTQFWMYTKF